MMWLKNRFYLVLPSFYKLSLFQYNWVLGIVFVQSLNFAPTTPRYLTHRNSINAVNFMIWLDALRHIHTIFTCQPITDPCLLWCRHNPRAANHLKQCMLRQHHGYHPQRQSLSRPLWLSVLTLNPSLIFLFLAKNSLFRVSADEQTKASQLDNAVMHLQPTIQMQVDYAGVGET